MIALDAATGETIWEYKYPSLINGTDINTDYGAGPHSTPLIVGDRLFAISTDKRFHAFDKRDGEVLWQYDMVANLGAPPLLLRPVVTPGYGCSPLAYAEGHSLAPYRGAPPEATRPASVMQMTHHPILSA